MRNSKDSGDSHQLDASVTTVTFDLPGYIRLPLLDDFVQELLWEKTILDSTGQTMEIFRMKGVGSVKGESRRMLMQAVHELFDRQYTTPWQDGETQTNRMVFIGRNLDKEVLLREFSKCVHS